MTAHSIIDFLNARLDEDEQVALRAQPGPWHLSIEEVGYDYLDYCVEAGREDDDVSVSRGDRYGHCNAQHIARHDPARVLREVAAKRRIIARHCTPNENSPWGSWRAELHEVAQPCIGCGFGGACDDPWTEDINDCPELCDLAAIYSDHPDYRQEWA